MHKKQQMSAVNLWFNDLWSQGNIAIADEIIAPDYAPDWIQIPKKGPAQVKHEVNYFRSVFPDLQYTIVDSVTLSEKVWIRYKGLGTQHGAAWGFAPSDKQVEFEGVTIFTINQNGKISDRWGAFCFYDMFADLGLVPPLWELSQQLQNNN